MSRPRPTLSSTLPVLCAGAVLAALGACSVDRDVAPPAASPPATSPPATSLPAASAPTVTRAAYRDGTYTATGWYGGAPSHVEVTITLAGGRITAARVVPQPVNNAIPRDYQERFAEAAPPLVVGRSVDEVALDHVAGSSGTPDGFNDALARIRGQAGVR